MKVAVCDDDINVLNILKHMIEKRTDIFTADYYNEIEKFKNAIINERSYDTVLMDIDWGGVQKGINIANQLFSYHMNIQIIYVTGYNDKFAQQIFLTPSNLCGYLLKPVNEKIFNSMIDKAADTIKKTHTQKFVIRRRNDIYAIPYNDILYLSSELHKIIIHCKDREYSYNGTLKDLNDLLPQNFAECHKSFYVNMNYVKHINKTYIEMIGGGTVPVSRSKYSVFLEQYINYVGQHL